MDSMDSVSEEWQELDLEFGKLQQWHSEYLKKIEEMKVLQTKCTSVIATQRYRMKKINESFKGDHFDAEEQVDKQAIEGKINERHQQFKHMEEYLPSSTGIYLWVILGRVNISLLSRIDRLNYKAEYEKFKLVLNIIIFFVSTSLFLLPYKLRTMDALLHFLLVWYYCTLTIREHILITNGSKIKGWWVMHHFISMTASGLFLVWPEGESYWKFRNQFGVFSSYISVVHLVQFYYQTGILYRMRSLGLKNEMDVSLDGFTSWMFRGFSFLLPFLFAAYLFQFWNAIALYNLSQDPSCTEWQVPALSMIFLVLGSGNMYTTMLVVRRRFQTHFSDYFDSNKYRFLKSKKG